MWIVALLIVIIVILMFGPVVTGLLALAAALGLGAVGIFWLFLLGLFALAILGGAGGWVIWWIFDRPGAMAALRTAQAEHDRKQEAKVARLMDDVRKGRR